MSLRFRRLARICGIVVIAVAVLLALPHILGVRWPFAATVDPSPHRAGRATAQKIPIDFLDWGGHGPALVFIPGFGNSAHIFDDFAPRFIPQFRVLGITRVGFGESPPPKHGYELSSRVEQIRGVLDSLGIARAILIGHSLGGDELTAFAGIYPERTAGLVYLDAAYDHVQALKEEEVLERYAALAPKPTPADLAGASAYQGWIERYRGVRFPIGEILATTRFNWNGKVVGSRAPDWVIEATIAAVQPPDYAKIRAPALALYSDWETAADFLPWLRADPVRNARITAVLRKEILPNVMAERARFFRDVKGARGVAFRSHHYNFLDHPDEVERRMRAFLASLPR